MLQILKKGYNYLVQFRVKKPWDLIIIFCISFLLTIPVFIIIHQNLSNWKLPLYLDYILLFLLLLSCIFGVLVRIRKITLLAVFFYFLLVLFGTFFGNYGFKQIASDYNSMLFSLNESPYPQDIIMNKLLPFPNKKEVIQAIDYKNPKVRNFAIMAANKYFKNLKPEDKYLQNKYYTLIQCFAVFKEINSHWNYINDPKNEEYIAAASESVQYLSGDCDDHAILMAACIRAIGGTPRLIHTDGHMYPEIMIGNKSDLEKINYLLKTDLFPNETKGKPINYHIDQRGTIWLNLDYTAHYPGGPFLHDVILGELVLE